MNLIKQISKLLTREKKHSPQFNVVVVDAMSDLPKDGIHQIQENEVDAIIFRNFISEEERKTLVNGFTSLDESLQVPMPPGHTFPRVFSTAHEYDDTPNSLEHYFTYNQQYRKEFPQKFKVDMEAKIREALSAMSGERNVDVPPGIDQVGSFLAGSFRELYKDYGGLPVHCDNQFLATSPHTTDHLEELLQRTRQMSFLVLLQKPQVGGELTFYDVKDEFVKDYRIEYYEEKGDIYEQHSKELLPKFPIELHERDFIVFAASGIFHSVGVPVEGNHRITYGGFMSISNDDQTLYFWS